MAARAIWKGVIGFGDVAVPVKLYSAVQDRKVHFRLLDAKEHHPVKQRMVNPRTGDEVAYEEVRRAFEVRKGELVVIEPEELEELEPEKSRDITVDAFLPPEAVEHPWYDRPYYLGPDGDDEAYFTLAAALRASDRVGLARWTMRNKEYGGVLRVEGDYLMLVTLRHAGEVVPVSALPAPTGRKLEKKELDMAAQLVAALEDTFEPAAFPNEYRERVMELIEAKASGKTIPLRAPKKPKKEGSLSEALEASLAAAKKGGGRAA